MEYQKHCMASVPDPAKGNQQFATGVTSRFTAESFHTLRRYMLTLPDIKAAINLQMRAQRFTDAGMTIARRAIEKKGDPKEKSSILGVSTKEISLLTGVFFC